MNEKILIVDDDLENLKLIGLMLQRRGYQIVAAQGGVQGLDKAEVEQPDLIILDVMMPDIDGFEVCRQLRATPGTAHTPIIMFTAKTAVADKVTGFQSGADDYLTKPIHPAELASRVEDVLLRSGHTRPSEVEPVAHARIIGFVGCKGGVGTSTLALNVAVALREEQTRVVLAELMTGGGIVGLQIGITRQLGISNLLNKQAGEIGRRLVESQLTTHTTGIKMLLAPYEPRLGSLPALHTKAIVNHLATQGDFLVLDLATGLDDGTRVALQMCHYVVIVTEAQRTALAMAQALKDELETIGIPHSNIGLVLVNRASSAASFSHSTIEATLKTTLLAVVPPAPELVFQAAEDGTPVVTMQPNSLISNQVRELARKIPKQ